MDRWMVETALSKRYPFYTRANVGEVFPDPVAPGTFSLGFKHDGGLGASEMGFRDAYEKIGAFDPSEYPPDENFFLGVAGGYAYLNAGAMRILGHRAPGMTAKDIDDSFFGDAPGVPPFVPQPGDDRPDLTEKIGATFQWVLTTDGLPEVAAEEELVNRLRAERPDFRKMSDRELLDFIWGLLDRYLHQLFTQHIYITFLATLPMGIIAGVCTAVGRPDAILKLIAGLGDVESAAPSLAMWELGRRAKQRASVEDCFEAGIHDLHTRLRAATAMDGAGAAWMASFDEFLYKYGSRGPNEWESRSPTWETDPDLALAAIDRMRVAPASAAPQTHNDERAREREALGEEITAMLAADPATQQQFQLALRAATIFMPGRERTKTNCVKLIQEARVALREFGRRMTDRGIFPKVISHGMLTRDETYALVADLESGSDGLRWRPVLDERERAFDDASQLQEPFLFNGEPPAMSTYPRRDAVVVAQEGLGAVLQGVPGCPGKARGRARVLENSHDPTALEPGDILVAPITDPSWTPLFVPAAAVVVNVGAPLSHAIIVSRELGIPCVVSVTDATKRIPDGALVEVDGTTGVVTILEMP